MSELGKLKSDEFSFQNLNSGHLCLELASDMSWDRFPYFVNEFLKRFNASLGKQTDAVDIRIWEIVIEGERIGCVFEDFPLMLSLESDTDNGDLILKRVKEELEKM